MTIKLRKDWDISITPPIHGRKPLGYFVGRHTEKEMLLNEIMGKKSGSILISGHRGVGKTSLVYKTLHEVKKDDPSTITVFLNAAQLEAEANTKDKIINPKLIIENLIRRLYSTTKTENYAKINSNTLEKIKALYHKAIASDFRKTHTATQSLAKKTEFASESGIEILSSGDNFRILYVIFFVLVGIVFGLVNVLLSSPDWVKAILQVFSILISVQSPFTASFAYRRIKRSEQTKKLEKSAEEFYKFDNSIGNLEFDLEEIHRELRNANKKLVYVIDELDKLTPGQVNETIKFFKNLFTLSEAIFIFIGGEEIYNYKSSGRGNSYRAEEYTYFTSRYFLTRPLWEDLNTYLLAIIENPEAEGDNIEVFKRAICFEAENDYFDLRTIIRDRINSFSNDGSPEIEIFESTDDLQKSNFHKAITLFDQKYFLKGHSHWQENEKVIRELFKQGHIVLSGYPSETFDDPQSEDIGDEVIREFNKLLWKTEVYGDNPQTVANVPIKGLNVEIKRYTLSGGVGKEPPESLDEPVEFEKRFINAFKGYYDFLISLYNIYTTSYGESPISEATFLEHPADYINELEDFGFDISSQFNGDYSLYKEIIENKLAVTRQIVNTRTEETKGFAVTLRKNLPTILANLFYNLHVDLTLNIQTLNQSDSVFVGSAQKIRDITLETPSLNHMVLNKDTSRQILFVENNIDAIKRLRKDITENSPNHRVISIVSKESKLRIKGFHEISTESVGAFEKNLESVVAAVGEFLNS